MFGLSFEQLAILIGVVLLIFGTRRVSKYDGLSQLAKELRSHMPVFSAETTRGKEAEFVRDGLPKRFPFWVVVVAFVLAAVTLWIVGAGLRQ